jgi:hypothetical protein
MKEAVSVSFEVLSLVAAWKKIEEEHLISYSEVRPWTKFELGPF